MICVIEGVWCDNLKTGVNLIYSPAETVKTNGSANHGVNHRQSDHRRVRVCKNSPESRLYKCAIVVRKVLVVIRTLFIMKWLRKGVSYCVVFGLIDSVTSQLPSYGSSSGGGGLSSGRGNVGGGSRQGSGGFNSGSGGSVQGSRGGGRNSGGDGDHQGLDWLRDSVPGEPGVDYPIYSLPVPDSSFSCDGRVMNFQYNLK